VAPEDDDPTRPSRRPPLLERDPFPDVHAQLARENRENARLRGLVDALERILAAYRNTPLDE
jgi:hypothetical protein